MRFWAHTDENRDAAIRQAGGLGEAMKAAKSKVRMPQRSEAVAGDEAKGMGPIAAAQKKNPTMQASPLKKPKATAKRD